MAKRKALPAHVERVTFNAITKAAVTEAMVHPRALDEDLIDAYRARRALDYLVGFTLSPVLWRKLPGAKSAGRVRLGLALDAEAPLKACAGLRRILLDKCRICYVTPPRLGSSAIR